MLMEESALPATFTDANRERSARRRRRAALRRRRQRLIGNSWQVIAVEEVSRIPIH